MENKRKLAADMLLITCGKIGTLLINFCTTLLLARMLMPEDYGVVAMCTILMSISSVLVDSGMGGSLIYHKDVNKIDFDTIFWFNLIVSLVLYLIILGCAGYFANFYHVPELKDVTRVIGLSIVIHSLCIVQTCMLTREGKFAVQSKIMIISSLLTSVFVVLLAWMKYGVWALVMQTILQNSINAILLMLYTRYRPDLIFSFPKLKKHWAFGSRMLGTSLLKMLYENMYVQIMGKVVAVKQAGFYNQAKRLNDIPLNVIQFPLEKVVFPYLARSNNFIDNIHSIIKWFVLCIIPFLILGTIYSSDIVSILLGEKWLESAWMLSYMFIGTIGASLESLNRNFIKSQGKIGELLKVDIYKRIVNILLIIALLSWGIKGLLVAFVINGFIGWMFNNWVICRLFHLSFVQETIHILSLLSTILPAALLSGTIKFFYPVENPFLSIGSGLLYFFLFYSLTVGFFRKEFFLGMMNKIRTIIFQSYDKCRK